MILYVSKVCMYVSHASSRGWGTGVKLGLIKNKEKNIYILEGLEVQHFIKLRTPYSLKLLNHFLNNGSLSNPSLAPLHKHIYRQNF
jgi:hypothetical protein